MEKYAIGSFIRAGMRTGALGAGIGAVGGGLSKKKKGESRVGRIARGALTGAAVGGAAGIGGVGAVKGALRLAGKKGAMGRKYIKAVEKSDPGAARKALEGITKAPEQRKALVRAGLAGYGGAAASGVAGYQLAKRRK